MRIILCAWNFSLSAIHNNKSCGWAHSCLGSKKMANYTKKLVQTSAKVQNVLYGSTCGSNKQFDTLSNRNFTTFLFFIFFLLLSFMLLLHWKLPQIQTLHKQNKTCKANFKKRGKRTTVDQFFFSKNCACVLFKILKEKL